MSRLKLWCQLEKQRWYTLGMLAKLLISSKMPDLEGEALKIIAQAGLRSPHPDLLWFDPNSKLGVAEVKQIRQFLSLKPYQSKGRGVVIIQADKLTTEAQNGLLKTLEEPPTGAVIVLGAISEDNLLPTVVSRCEVVQIKSVDSQNQPDDGSGQIEKLLKMSTEDRFKYIEKLDDKEGLLQTLTIYSQAKLKDDHNFLTFSKDLIEAQKWAARSVNLRAILEYLMLKLPSKP